ncbi:Uncharacterized conserved protein YlxW, UPF0749 family [Geodermatophilus telluris]|uniref:Uncharacterized conserved protein YlxW, UPF0749 family n=1 Tax=Geodermatophilus telluris TaxID=1190417 RepID=A0A1G6T6X3_9ACTN|nr:DUF881 domain-containing protein [Geodermatophilus telluris]SDD24624.1 Uncharacterized conserved protein YlxW, UPF0749 family [Geodermatophilus telluris]
MSGTPRPDDAERPGPPADDDVPAATGERPAGEEQLTEEPAPEEPAPEEPAPEEPAPEEPAPEEPAPEEPTSEERPAAPAAGPARRRQRRVAGALIAVLTLLLGFAIAVQVRNTDTGEALAATREEDLVGILDSLDSREAQLRQQIADQRAALRDLSGTDSRSAAALEEATARAQALAVLNGTVAAEGPGLVMTIRDPQGQVRVADLLDAVQELRGAGAETLQIDGVRVGVSTAVTGEPGALRIDGRPVSAPYEVVVIGSPQDLQTAMSIPGGVVDRVGRQGGSVDIEQRDRVVVDALRPLDEPQYAQPQTE